MRGGFAYLTKTLYLCIINQNRNKMKWSEIERKAIEKGWYLIRHGREHDIYGHKDRDYQIHIERHKSAEVKSGLYCKLKKQIGF